MRKIGIILFSLCFILTSCGSETEKEIDKTIKYSGSNTVNIVLMENYNLKASSEESLTYYSDDELIVTVSKDGKLFGKNVGEANVTISNSENSIEIHVIVSLFEEPTLDFGCNRDKILSLYKSDKLVHNSDSVVIYSNWYSYAVWTMSFFFKDNMYYESDLYIRNDLDLRLDQFLLENYYYRGMVLDNNNKEIYIYYDSYEESEASVMIGKQYHANNEDDICLMYIPYTPEGRERIRCR